MPGISFKALEMSTALPIPTAQTTAIASVSSSLVLTGALVLLGLIRPGCGPPL